MPARPCCPPRAPGWRRAPRQRYRRRRRRNSRQAAASRPASALQSCASVAAARAWQPFSRAPRPISRRARQSWAAAVGPAGTLDQGFADLAQQPGAIERLQAQVREIVGGLLAAGRRGGRDEPAPQPRQRGRARRRVLGGEPLGHRRRIHAAPQVGGKLHGGQVAALDAAVDRCERLLRAGCATAGAAVAPAQPGQQANPCPEYARHLPPCPHCQGPHRAATASAGP